MNKTKLATVIFVLGIIAAGVFHMCERSQNAYFSTFCFCASISIYFSLLLFWIQSVRKRILPSKSRTYIIGAAVFIVFILFVRSIRFRVFDYDDLMQRYTWYLYYVLLIMIVAMFLLTCISLDKRFSKFDIRLLLIPSVILIALIMTNDLHYMYFRPVPGIEFDGQSGDYTINFMYYVFYAYLIAYVISGIIFIVRALRQNFKKTIMPFAFLGLGFLMYGMLLLFSALGLIKPFDFPVIAIFIAIGVFESCIRSRLIPYNENYSGFFAIMDEPALITAKDYNAVYSTRVPVSADGNQLREALDGVVRVDDDTLLHGRELKSGYAFWIEDESELNLLNKKLAQASTILSAENELIQQENLIREEKESIEIKAQIYSEALEKVRPYTVRIDALLKNAKPDSPDFKRTVARVSALNAFIKRGVNLIVGNDGVGKVDSRGLRLAIEEMSIYLRYLDLDICVTAFYDCKLNREDAFNLFSDFESIVSSLNDSASTAVVSFSAEKLRLEADCVMPEKLPDTVFNVTAFEEDDVLYYDIVMNGGEAE